MVVVLIVLLVILAFLTYRYYITSLILSAWIAENDFTPPTDEDVKRLAKWVAQKMFEKKH